MNVVEKNEKCVNSYTYVIPQFIGYRVWITCLASSFNTPVEARGGWRISEIDSRVLRHDVASRPGLFSFRFIRFSENDISSSFWMSGKLPCVFGSMQTHMHGCNHGYVA